MKAFRFLAKHLRLITRSSQRQLRKPHIVFFLQNLISSNSNNSAPIRTSGTLCFDWNFAEDPGKRVGRNGAKFDNFKSQF